MFRVKQFALVFLAPLATAATTINVPADYPTIQAGIDATTDGDTVLVFDGIYTGSGNRDIDFGGRLIVVKSVSGPGWTTIDCEGNESNYHVGFIFQSAERPVATLDGFTIKKGYGGTAGGGIQLRGSSPTIRNCVFSNNRSSQGGAVGIAQGRPRLENCVFKDNSAQWGGAVCTYDASLTITQCTFWNNRGEPQRGQIGIENYSVLNIDHSLLIKDFIIVQPPDQFADIGPSWLIPHCCIHFVRGANDGSVPGDSPETSEFIDVDPQLCDTLTAMYTLQETSPCLPQNNQCGALIGAWDAVCVGTDIDEPGDNRLPDHFSLSQNYPNPFNPDTRIEFLLPKTSAVMLEVFDILGRKTITLVNERMSAGRKIVVWDGRANDGSFVPSGIYLYRIMADDFVRSRKMLLLK